MGALSTGALVDMAAAVASELAARQVHDSAAVCMEWAEALMRAADVQESVLARLIGVVDGSGELRRWGLPSTQAWLRSRLGMRDARAKERVQLARQLPRVPEVAERLGDGSLSSGYAVAIVQSVARLGEEDCVRAEELLLEMADDGFSAGKVAAFGSRIREVIAERDGTEQAPDDAVRGYERSWIASTRSLDGGRYVKGWLNAEDAAVWDGILGPLAKPAGPEDRRDLPERTAAALSSVLSGGHRGTKVTLVIDLDTLTGGTTPHHDRTGKPVERLPGAVPAAVSWPLRDVGGRGGVGARLLDGTPIPAEQARRIALSAGVSPLLLGSGGVPLYLGRRVRFASVGQRRVLEALYPRCVVRGCEVPGTLCEVDHVQGWVLGDAPTDVDRLALCCGWHNRAKHTDPGLFQIDKDQDGRFIYRLLPPPDAHGQRRPPPTYTPQPTCTPEPTWTSESQESEEFWEPQECEAPEETQEHEGNEGGLEIVSGRYTFRRNHRRPARTCSPTHQRTRP
ncbi:DUF222 domain-containing protein [Actinomadura sp. 9N407]|uniref:HNH endonuclease signature motif containing protein n=1 Tax=Actinomadura sp. 9N407 TaxID=3375154 RepID=UPI00379122C6